MKSVDTSKILTILVSSVLVPEYVLRQAEKKAINWPDFVASLKNDGQLQPIKIRIGGEGEQLSVLTGLDEKACPVFTTRDVSGKQLLIDGMQRMSGVAELYGEGATVQAIVSNAKNQIEADFESMVSNLQKIETKPAHYARLIRRLILTENFTLEDIAKKISKSKENVLKLLSLNKLDDSVLKLVDSKEIPLGNAFALVKYATKFPDINVYIEKAKTTSLVNFEVFLQNQYELQSQSMKSEREIHSMTFTPDTRFIRDRLDKEKIRIDIIRESMEMGDQITDFERGQVELMKFLFNEADSDIAEQKKEFEEKKEKLLKRVK
jgi:ParB/RepB/Spo0J family partition protein